MTDIFERIYGKCQDSLLFRIMLATVEQGIEYAKQKGIDPSDRFNCANEWWSGGLDKVKQKGFHSELLHDVQQLMDLLQGIQFEILKAAEESERDIITRLVGKKIKGTTSWVLIERGRGTMSEDVAMQRFAAEVLFTNPQRCAERQGGVGCRRLRPCDRLCCHRRCEQLLIWHDHRHDAARAG